MSAAEIEAILAEHTLGFMGRCVTEHGDGDACPWRAKRSDQHGNYGHQHRAHVAQLIADEIATNPTNGDNDE